VKLLVVGKGKPLHSRSGNVIFAGSMSNVEDAYAAADLIVFLPIYEPSSNVVYEALAAGLPVVTSTYNGASELIEPDVNGTVIDLSNVDFPLKVFESLARWERRTSVNPTVDNAAVSLDRNVSETLAILEMAAKERNA
jgi:UDP-glucose:(heptosyl)LPS alpha-1,3-glucosyltransferase